MRLLLDTHVAIWLTNTPERLSNQLRGAIEDSANQVSVSVAAVWEIAIKHALGRSDAPPLSAHQAVDEFAAADLSMLDVTASHATFVERLPMIHADPFDRLMLAQAAVENMQFVTYDRQLSRYDVAMLTL
ncbi:MAG: type II toxin-antitoxin system VapC family toxin [Rhizobiaceae bacterium]